MIRSHKTEGVILVQPQIDYTDGVTFNDLYVRDSLTVDSVITFPCATFKAHRLRPQTGSVDTTWTDCFAFEEIEDESCDGVVELIDSIHFVIQRTGLYQFGGCVHVQNNTGGGFNDILVLTRLTNNGTEMKCSQRGYAGDVRAGGEDVLSYNGTASLTKLDTIKLQYYTNNTSLDFTSNSAFDEQVAYTLWLNYIGN